MSLDRPTQRTLVWSLLGLTLALVVVRDLTGRFETTGLVAATGFVVLCFAVGLRYVRLEADAADSRNG